MGRRGSSNSRFPLLLSLVVLAAAGAGVFWMWSAETNVAPPGGEEAVRVPLQPPANPEPDAADAADREKALEVAERIREAEANPDAVEIPSPKGDMEELERTLGDAHPGVVVENKACDPDVCVFALRIEDAADAEARNAVVIAAGKAAFEMEAQPTFRWEEEGEELVGYMWLMPSRLTAEESTALIKRAEKHVSALGE